MSKDIKNLQKRWNTVLETVHGNSHVVAFMNSRVGRYLDDHPFVALTLLVFIAASAIPVSFFLIFIVSTTVIAFLGVVVMEGFLISLGGITLLCVLGGLSMLSLAVSGVLSVCYLSLTTLLNYWPTSGLPKSELANGSSVLPNDSPAIDKDTNKKSE